MSAADERERAEAFLDRLRARAAFLARRRRALAGDRTARRELEANMGARIGYRDQP